MQRLADLLYLMAPAYAANMAPPLLARLWKGWNAPVSRRWLGGHKTVLGFAAGLLAAAATGAAQHAPLFGLALGAGALAGDALKSFFKRRLGIAPGAAWFPADQLDFALGALVIAAPWARLGAMDIAVILAVSVAGHIAVNHAAWCLGIRKTRW